MRAHGSDRVRRTDGERITLASRLSKGWVPRAAKTLTSAEFPGTAVLWDEEYFEVIDAQSLPGGGVEYVLEPWREHHVMRVVEPYDEASEGSRMAAHREHLAREKGRKTANAAALFTGHLPAVVQNRIGNDLGILPNRITLVSVLGEWAFLAGIVLWIVSYLMRDQPPPFALILVAVYFGLENTIRFMVVFTQSRPIGSSVGLIVYLMWWLVAGRRATSPFAVEKGRNVTITPTPDERKLHDLLLTREALVTLLPGSEQQRVAARFGYDYRRQSTLIAGAILAFCVVGVVSSLYRNAVVALLIAAALAAEQLYRLAALRRRPVGSVFGILVRPFVRKLL